MFAADIDDRYRDADARMVTRAQSLRAWIERCIEKELHRCGQCMTPDEWREHRDWIEEHARACLWYALEQRAKDGELQNRGKQCRPA
ncbi:hypothetical protein QCE73_08765 [Caballeronia sp. LZ029]|uniref:hypothetical protein n=1 Tax=Caballeronia sp. LZ029 TaxID=3038564 RepID=UPI00285DA05D|nr:hypothetical protein [Caballeronia sp. LZ029]MDR5743245.1 hypothetical protein [Caballeronia sp. LZ029]